MFKRVSAAVCIAICACLCVMLPKPGYAGPSKKSSALCLLQLLHQEHKTGSSVVAASLLKREHAAVTVRFVHELSPQELDSIERRGVRFSRTGGRIVHFDEIYAAAVPWHLIDRLALDELVERIEPTWLPAAQKPLDVSVPAIGASEVWKLSDDDGRPITGTGIIIADFDSGVDVFHPLFWKADGEKFAWLDVNGNGAFDFGVDAVDLNSNGEKDAGESLDYIDASIWEFKDLTTFYDDVREGGFQPDVDWLYADANSNGRRDYDTSRGFTESDATFGEQVFVAEDANGNRVLDPGEQLIALRTSKIIATLNTDKVERRRGTDLISTEDNPDGHGTAVAGILCGGTRGVHKYTGVAPDAELLVQNIFWGEDNTPWAEGMAWAEQQGARVMLHEIGSWVFEFMDGSSNIETAIDAEAEKGIVQVVPAGNLGGAGRHARVAVPGGQSQIVPFEIPMLWPWIRYAFVTVLWRGPLDSLQVAVRTPYGFFNALPGDSTQVMVGLGAWAWSNVEQSSRGTSKFDIMIYDGFFGLWPLAAGTWALQIENAGNAALAAEGYIADEATTWSGGARFLEHVTDNGTIDFPATADSAITVASYSTRGLDFEAIGLQTGGLSGFSSRGKRIDGQSIMDVAAPGNLDVISALAKDDQSFGINSPLGSYVSFGGTSAAGPHVAGVAALLLQAFPQAGHLEIQEALQEGARTDTFTGDVPNDLWGYGKLDAVGAFNWLKEHVQPADAP